MVKMKVYELARKLNVTNGDLLEKIANLGIVVSSHMSALEDEDLKKIQDFYKARDEVKIIKKTPVKVAEKKELFNKELKKEVLQKSPDVKADVDTSKEVAVKKEEKIEVKKPVKVKVYELARTLGVSNSDLLEKIAGLGILAKTHMSAVDGEDLKKIQDFYKDLDKAKATEKKEKDEVKKEVINKIKKEALNEIKKEEKTIELRENKFKTPDKKNEKPQVKVNDDFNERDDNKKNDKKDSKKESKKNDKKDVKIKEDPIERKRREAEETRKLKEEKALKAKNAEEITIKQIPSVITVKDLAGILGVKGSELVMKFMKKGQMLNINASLDFETATSMAEEYDIILEQEEEKDIMEVAFAEEVDDEKNLKSRPPVVVVMGHVDHGKTSLLDCIRHSSVTKGEAGGITQHIGAYTVEIDAKPITFLDTPGHEAFTAMRMRGAQITDIAILVVAADDGVMPQTIEAINHAKAAGVEIIVAINKMDKPSANPDRVKQELTEYDLQAEDWGGSTICVPVSAVSKEGIDTLLEMIILAAEMKELKANPAKKARGAIIEAQLDKGRGPVATVLVQNGTLEVGDPIVAGQAYGKIRAMTDDKGRRVTKATPSQPVEILGLSQVPTAGDGFYVAASDKQARRVAQEVLARNKTNMIKETPSKVSLDDLFSQIQSGNVKELNIVVKADVQGSVEAVHQSLEKLSNEEVRVRIIHGGVGAINESDIMLAAASNAIVIGFNVRAESASKDFADREKVDVRLYRVIYNAIEDVQAAMKGMLDPIFEEKILGHAEIRQLFKASGIGTIAGSYVKDGKFIRNCQVRILRDNIVVHEGDLDSLKRFKDDVKEVTAGFECGLVFKKFNDIREGDWVEAFMMVEVER